MSRMSGARTRAALFSVFFTAAAHAQQLECGNRVWTGNDGTSTEGPWCSTLDLDVCTDYFVYWTGPEPYVWDYHVPCKVEGDGCVWDPESKIECGPPPPPPPPPLAWTESRCQYIPFTHFRRNVVVDGTTDDPSPSNCENQLNVLDCIGSYMHVTDTRIQAVGFYRCDWDDSYGNMKCSANRVYDSATCPESAPPSPPPSSPSDCEHLEWTDGATNLRDLFPKLWCFQVTDPDVCDNSFTFVNNSIDHPGYPDELTDPHYTHEDEDDWGYQKCTWIASEQKCQADTAERHTGCGPSPPPPPPLCGELAWTTGKSNVFPEQWCYDLDNKITCESSYTFVDPVKYDLIDSTDHGWRECQWNDANQNCGGATEAAFPGCPPPSPPPPPLPPPPPSSPPPSLPSPPPPS